MPLSTEPSFRGTVRQARPPSRAVVQATHHPTQPPHAVDATRRRCLQGVLSAMLTTMQLQAATAAPAPSGVGSVAAPQPPNSSAAPSSSQCSSTLPGEGAPIPAYCSRWRDVSLLVPCGWTQVQGLGQDDEFGVVASFYNPQQAGLETLALYTSDASGLRDTTGLGTDEQVGLELANIAPFGALLEHRKWASDGVTYYYVRVMFGGNTAGMFGAVMECRCIAVHKGVKYTLRGTTSRYRWLALPEVPLTIAGATASLRVV